MLLKRSVSQISNRIWKRDFFTMFISSAKWRLILKYYKSIYFIALLPKKIHLEPHFYNKNSTHTGQGIYSGVLFKWELFNQKARWNFKLRENRTDDALPLYPRMLRADSTLLRATSVGFFCAMRMSYFAPNLSLLHLFFGGRKEASRKLSFEWNISFK